VPLNALPVVGILAALLAAIGGALAWRRARQ
jgi:hypothetical protein